jgi:hypothetical protein
MNGIKTSEDDLIIYRAFAIQANYSRIFVGFSSLLRQKTTCHIIVQGANCSCFTLFNLQGAAPFQGSDIISRFVYAVKNFFRDFLRISSVLFAHKALIFYQLSSSLSRTFFKPF